MNIILGVELIGLYLLWRLGLWRRLVKGLDSVLTRTANGRPSTAKRIAQAMVRVADYLELTRGTRLTPATLWFSYLIGGVIVSELLAGSNDDTPRVLLSLVLLVVLIGVMLAVLVGSSLYNRAAQRAMARLLPDALGIMGDEISAGHAIEAAVQRVALQFGKPINEEFGDALIKMVASGGLIPIDEALSEIAQNPVYQNDALDQAALTIAVVRPLGGDLGELLTDLARLLRRREATEREIRTQLAPGRQAAWTLVFIIGGLELGLSVFPIFSPVLWGTYAGRFVLILALILIGLSIYWIMAVNSKDV
ncbi:MAG: type II secretion system F family protein [Aggregatilineales bacterium]